jgi:small-conductance mechanosensitive channel
MWRIPNATVYKGIILNYSRNLKRRFTFEGGIDTAVNSEAVLQLASKTLEQTSGVIVDPPGPMHSRKIRRFECGPQNVRVDDTGSIRIWKGKK